MKTTLKVFGWSLVVALLLSITLVAAAAAWLLPIDHGVITINEDSITLAALHGTDWLVAVLLVLAAILVVILIVPVAVLVPLLVIAFGLAVTILATLGVALFVLSPLLLIVWVVWRLARAEKPRRVDSATMGA